MWAAIGWQIGATCALMFIATGTFGGAFVTMTWALEAVHLDQQGKETKKEHLRLLLKTVDEAGRNARVPLAAGRRLKQLWNLFFFCTAVLLLLAALVLAYPDRWWLLSVGGAGIPSLLLPLWNKYTVKKLAAGGVWLIIFEGLLLVHGQLSSRFLLLILLEGMQILYLGTYVLFRQSNYDSLYSALDTLLQSLRQGCRVLGNGLLLLLVGAETKKVWKKSKRRKRGPREPVHFRLCGGAVPLRERREPSGEEDARLAEGLGHPAEGPLVGAAQGVEVDAPGEIGEGFCPIGNYFLYKFRYIIPAG